MGSPHSSRQPNNRYIFFFTFLYHQLIPGVANCKNAPPDSFAMPLGWPRKDNLMSTLPGMRREPHMFSMMKASSKGQVTSLASNFKSKKKKKKILDTSVNYSIAFTLYNIKTKLGMGKIQYFHSVTQLQSELVLRFCQPPFQDKGHTPVSHY